MSSTEKQGDFPKEKQLGLPRTDLIADPSGQEGLNTLGKKVPEEVLWLIVAYQN
ncbi:MAG: hypothetical protein LBF22_02865 [Deltaproteobacteria bacterium]|jgi:hypothetical protein|nr:hypothetical protein [Deltaproteobacteria bacterium]